MSYSLFPTVLPVASTTVITGSLRDEPAFCFWVSGSTFTVSFADVTSNVESCTPIL